jgi:hypothetical protein
MDQALEQAESYIRQGELLSAAKMAMGLLQAIERKRAWRLIPRSLYPPVTRKAFALLRSMQAGKEIDAPVFQHITLMVLVMRRDSFLTDRRHPLAWRQLIRHLEQQGGRVSRKDILNQYWDLETAESQAIWWAKGEREKSNMAHP